MDTKADEEGTNSEEEESEEEESEGGASGQQHAGLFNIVGSDVTIWTKEG